MRKTLLCGALVGAALALPAAASATTLEGDCTLSGTAKFTFPVTATGLTGNSLVLDGHGPCTGTLDGNAIDARDALVKIAANDAALTGCGLSAASGADGTLTFVNGKLDSTVLPTDPPDPPDQVLKLTVDELGVATEFPFRFTGANSGLAVGEITYRDGMTADAAYSCQGTGISAIDWSATMHEVQTLDG